MTSEAISEEPMKVSKDSAVQKNFMIPSQSIASGMDVSADE